MSSTLSARSGEGRREEFSVERTARSSQAKSLDLIQGCFWSKERTQEERMYLKIRGPWEKASAKDCDVRFSVWSERLDSGDRGMLPSAHFGRMCVDTKTKGENEFLKLSNLGVKRRPDRIVQLPATNALVLAESLSADADTYSRDRVTFSLEKVAAQKGIDYGKVIISAVVAGLPLSTTDPVLVVDFTPHVGDNALACRALMQDNKHINLNYISFETDSKEFKFSSTRVSGELAKEFMEEIGATQLDPTPNNQI
jgi:hypothetical protein